MISIDTELMKHLTEGCISANESIEEAVTALAGIVSHDEWGCREKVRINEYTSTNKKKVKELQENSRAFLKVLIQVTNDFEAAENSIADAAANVDSQISGIVGIASIAQQSINDIVSNSMLDSIRNSWNTVSPDGTVIFSSNSSISNAVSEACSSVTNVGSMGAFLSKTAENAISVCNFTDLII